MSVPLDKVAQFMGMPAHEILAAAEVGDCVVVTTHDGIHTIITENGELRPVPADTDVEAVKAKLAGFADPAAAGGEPVGDDGQGNGEQATEVGDLDGDGVPDGNAKEVLAWVGADVERAAAALAAEVLREKPRAGLTASLEKVAPAS